MVEHFLGKEEVGGSIPLVSSIEQRVLWLDSGDNGAFFVAFNVATAKIYPLFLFRGVAQLVE